MDIILFFLIIFLPGFLLLRIFFSKIEAFSIPPLSFVFGLILLLFTSLLSYLLRLQFSQSIFIVLLYIAILLLLNLRKKIDFKIVLHKDFTSYLLLFLLIGVSFSMFFLRAHLNGDALYHLAQIRVLAENSPVSPYEAVFPIHKVSPAYGYNVWYFALALVSALAKIDVATTWFHLMFILVPLSLLAVFAFASSLFKERLVALTTTIIYVVLIGYLALGFEFKISPYPDQVARHIVLFMAFVLFFQFIESKSWKYLVFTVLSAVLMTNIHLYSWVHFLIAALSFGVVGFVFINREVFINSVKVIVLVIVTSLPYLLLKLQNTSSIVGEVNLKKDAKVLFDGLFVINPFSKGKIFVLAVLLLIYLIILYRHDIKKRIWLIFIGSNAFASIFILFNPFLAPLVAKTITYTYMHRLGYLVYLEAIFAAFIFYGQISSEKSLVGNKTLRSILVVVVLSLLLIIPAKARATATQLPDADLLNLTKFIKTGLPARSVFAANMWTSDRIPAFTNNYIVATFPTAMTANIDKETRVEDLRTIFSPETLLSDVKSKLDEYNVSFVVVSLKQEYRYDIEIDTVKFAKDPAFMKIYSNNSYRLYKYKADFKEGSI